MKPLVLPPRLNTIYQADILELYTQADDTLAISPPQLTTEVIKSSLNI